MVLTRDILVVRNITTVVIQSGSTSSCDDCLDGVTIEGSGVLSRLQIADIDAADVILIGIVDALDVLRVDSLRLQACAQRRVRGLVESRVHGHL